MTLFKWRFFIEKISGFDPAPSGHLIATADGVIVFERNMPPSLSLFNNIPDKGMHTSKWDIVLSNTSGTYSQRLEVWRTSDNKIMLQKIHSHLSPPSSLVQRLTWQARGLPSAPPTYLEELAKLDQYSKAQYIPRDKR